MTFEHYSAWLAERVARATNLAPADVDPTAAFSALGLESIDAVELSGELSDLVGRELDPTLLYEFPTIEDLARRLSQLDAEPRPGDERRSAPDDQAVAIVGYSCRVPGAASPAAFWGLLLRGEDAISEVPPDRWNIDGLYDPDPSKPGRVSTRWGGFLPDVDGFDHGFFDITPAEARVMDPQQRLVLELAWDALADANIAPSTLSGSRTGVFIGASHNDFEAQHLRDVANVSGFSGIGNALSVLANRVSYKLNLKGPSLVVDTACSSSLVAVHLAVQSLRRGEASMALAGGVNVILSPDATMVFSRAGMMAPDGRCKSFDAAANGYVRGEGGGVVVLKRLADALAAGDPIHAVILGGAMNQDGRTNGLSAPNPAAQEDVLRAAYADAKVEPRSVAYVETHGTGTSLGDPIEANALGRVIGAGARSAPCWIGAVKSNIGHLEAAAGVVGLIKTALVLEHGWAPPNVHFKAINPKIDLQALGLAVPTGKSSLPPDARAGVSGFGFGGTNCHLVLAGRPEEAGDDARSPEGSRPQLVCLSAGSAAALDQLQGAWRDLADNDPPVDGTAAAANLGRDHYRYRRAFVVDRADELREKLTKSQGSKVTAVRGAPKVGFVFAGQGAQYAGMARELLDRFDVFADSLRRSDQIAAGFIDTSLVDEIMRPDGESRLSMTSLAQPALAAVQIALVDLWESFGVRPQAVLGHSVGEIAAAYCAGVLDQVSAIRLACIRGALMERSAGAGAMLAVQQGADVLARRIAERGLGLDIAAENGPGSCVCAGDRDEVLAFAQTLQEDGVPSRLLPVGYAFHSRLMDAAAEALAPQLAWLGPAAGQAVLISTVTGAEIDGRSMDAAYWSANLRGVVKFQAGVEQLLASGVEAIFDLGPDSVLTSHLRKAIGAAGATTRLVPGLARRLPADRALLEGAGSAYEAGVRLQLDALTPDRPRRLRGPGHPWARSTDLRSARLKARSMLQTSSMASAHPLLIGETPTPERSPVRLWSGRLDARTSAWIEDHKVAGSVILPGAAVIDLFLTVAREAIGDGAGLQDVVISRPVRASTDGEVEILVKFQRNRKGGELEMFVRTSDGHEWVSTAQAAAAVSTGQDVDTGEARSALMRCLEQLPAAPFYKLMNQVGLEYGPHFRRISDVWRTDGEALASLSPSTLTGSFSIAPDLLDGALQALAAAFPGFAEEQSPWAPVAVGEVVMRGAPTRAHVKLVSMDPARGRAVADVLLLDEKGRLAGRLSSVEVQRLARAPLATIRSAAADHRFYDEVWNPQPVVAGATTPGRWLLVGRGGESDLALAAELESRGQRVVRVFQGRSYRAAGPDSFELDLRHRGDVRELTRSLLGTGAEPFEGVLCTWSVSAADDEAGSVAAILGLARDLAFGASARTPRLWLVTRGAQLVGPAQSTLSPGEARLWGAAFALAFELPDLRCSRLDLDPDDGAGGASPVLVDFLLSAPDGDQFALREEAVWRRRLIETAPPQVHPAELDPDAAYLVTGGFGALGLAAARRLADRGARRLILLGRTAPRPPAVAVLDELRGRDVAIHEVLADVADRDGVRTALAPLLQSGVRIRGVFHAAGVVEDGPVTELVAQDIERAARPKVDGAWVLHELSADWPLDFFVLFSSASAALGSIGQGAYMAANAFLRAFANYRRKLGLPALCVEWGPWGGEGMASQALSAGRGKAVAGVSMIEPEEGMDTLFRLMAADAAQAIVLPYDLRDLVHIYPAAMGLHLFELLFDGELEQLRSAGAQQAIAARPDLDQAYVAPRTELESIIAGIWQRSLGIEGIGVQDAFFELGGDSVYAGQILAQINRTFGIELDAEAAFENLTIENLAVLVEAMLIASVEALSDEEAQLVLADAS